MPSPSPAPGSNPYASQKTTYYALGLLTVVYSFNFIDRQLLAILQESIKADLLLSDGQLGLLYIRSALIGDSGAKLLRNGECSKKDHRRLSIFDLS